MTQSELAKKVLDDCLALKPKEDLDKYLRQFGANRMAGELFFRLLFSCLIDAYRLDSERFGNPQEYQLRRERSNAVTIERLWDVFDHKQEEFVKGSKEPESRGQSDSGRGLSKMCGSCEVKTGCISIMCAERRRENSEWLGICA